jgi:hypothetical protein
MAARAPSWLNAGKVVIHKKDVASNQCIGVGEVQLHS